MKVCVNECHMYISVHFHIYLVYLRVHIERGAAQVAPQDFLSGLSDSCSIRPDALGCQCHIYLLPASYLQCLSTEKVSAVNQFHQ